MVNIIYAENKLHSKLLLNNYNIKTPMRCLHEHNEIDKTNEIINKILKGNNIALISDAGTPLISDPGYLLVTRAKQHSIKVSPIVGASSVIAALSVSGLATNSFSFFGFFPSKHIARLKVIKSIANTTQTAIFYESPKRILSCFKDLEEVLGMERIVCLAKELTKTFEVIKTTTLPKLIDYLQEDKLNQKGEFVVLISAIDKNNQDNDKEKVDKILKILLTETTVSKSARMAAKITGANKKYCYQKALFLADLLKKD